MGQWPYRKEKKIVGCQGFAHFSCNKVFLYKITHLKKQYRTVSSETFQVNFNFFIWIRKLWQQNNTSFSPLASLQKFRQGILSKLKTRLKRSVHPLGQKAYPSFLPSRKEGFVLMYFSHNLDIWADTELKQHRTKIHEKLKCWHSRKQIWENERLGGQVLTVF